MSRLIDKKTVKFVGYSDLNGNPVIDWHEEYMNLAGILCLYESENSSPGQIFIYYYPNEPDDSNQRYFNSTPGTIIEKGNLIYLESGHRYVFEVGDFIPEDELILLELNVFAR